MFAPSFSPSGSHTHLPQTTKYDAIMDNKFNKICWKHEFHKTSIRRGLYDKITKQIEYEPCPECIVEKEQKEKEEILKLEAESNRIAKETFELNLKKLNSVLRREAKEVQLAEKLANAELARQARENRLAKETFELNRKKLNSVFESKAKEIYLAEEAARIVKDDEKAELLLKIENLRIHNEETGLRRRQEQEAEAEDERRRQQAEEAEQPQQSEAEKPSSSSANSKLLKGIGGTIVVYEVIKWWTTGTLFMIPGGAPFALGLMAVP